MYHILWKNRPVGIQPFALAINEILDAFNPPILVPGTTRVCDIPALGGPSLLLLEADKHRGVIQARQWRKPLSCAYHAYCRLLLMREDLAVKALELSPLQVLGTICPACFGPFEPSSREQEPDYIISFDGNFQHRRLENSSVEHEELPIVYPPLFLNPREVESWEPGRRGQPGAENHPVSFFS